MIFWTGRHVLHMQEEKYHLLLLLAIGPTESASVDEASVFHDRDRATGDAVFHHERRERFVGGRHSGDGFSGERDGSDGEGRASKEG